MEAHRNVSGEDLKWLDTNENIYLQVLYERVRNDPNNVPSFKTSDYQQMDEEIFAAIGTRFPDVLKAKYNCLYNRYQMFSELLDHTGVIYDASSNTVFAPEETWQKFFMVKFYD